MKGVVNVEDLRKRARRRLPRALFDYLDGGAGAEQTLRENVTAFEAVRFRPRVPDSGATCDLQTSALGMSLSVPFLLGPIGCMRLLFPDADRAAAAAAGDSGTALVLSGLSNTPLEDVKMASRGPAAFQLFTIGGRRATQAALDRAWDAGYESLVVTVDTPLIGNRERDARNRLGAFLAMRPPSVVSSAPQLVAKMRWLAGYLADGSPTSFPNVVRDSGPMTFWDVASSDEHSPVTWDDIRWIREKWHGTLAVKGVLTAAAAKGAVASGVDSVIVSNHGGRQLDGVTPSLIALLEVASAVNGRAEVLMDGGIRRGSDIVKALCLGARAVIIGRAYAYGIASDGSAGASTAISILRAEMIRTLKLLGCSTTHDLGPAFADVPRHWATYTST